MYSVVMKRKVARLAAKMPIQERRKFEILLQSLKNNGPEQPTFSNYSKLSENTYHCHLSYKWVACWKNENGSLTIEVYYAGSREKAPY